MFYWSQTSTTAAWGVNVGIAVASGHPSWINHGGHGHNPNGRWSKDFYGFSLRCVRDSTIRNSTLILDVSLENLTTGLIDRSIYGHPQIGGTTGVEPYSEGGIKLLRRSGLFTFPKWEINKVVLPMTIEYEVKRFEGISGHGNFAFFFDRDQPRENFMNHALTSWGTNNFSPAHSHMFSPWPGFSPTVPVNEWTKVRVEYSAPNSGRGEIRTYFNGSLKSVIVIPEGYRARNLSEFTLFHESFSAHDVANAAVRNLKIWTTK
jgi:hypothetical protein